MSTTETTLESVRTLIPPRPSDGHKGTFGHVFIVAGSKGFTGAPKLCALGAGRSGAGLVTVGIPASLSDSISSSLLEAMSLALPCTEAGTLSHAAVTPAAAFATDRKTVVLGPGLSQNPETETFVRKFVTVLRSLDIPMVLDADGINNVACSKLRTILGVLPGDSAPLILTPHPGEMARLLNLTIAQVQADRIKSARKIARAHQCVVALKGHRTVVAAPDGRISINTTGNAGMGTGGSGDVLSGILGGLLAQGMGAYQATVLGVYLHGLAGDIAAREKTERGMIAGDIAEAIPAAWRILEGNA